MDIRNTNIKENFLIIRIGDKLKTASIKFHVGEIKFPVYENVNVCLEKLFKQYIDVTKSLRGSITCLFITTLKSYRSASKDTLARRIKPVLHDIGLDITFFHRNQQDRIQQSKQQQKYLWKLYLKQAAGVACERLKITTTNKFTIQKCLQLAL